MLVGLVAQADAAYRVYLVPLCATNCGTPPAAVRYFGTAPELVGVNKTLSVSEDFAIVYADVTPGQHTFLNAQADVLAAPLNLDANLTGAQVAALQTYLEARNAPANWVTTAETPRSALRQIAWMGQVLRRLKRLNGRLFGGGVTLATTFSELPLAVRNALRQAAEDLQLDTTGMTGATTLRQILRALGQQKASVPIQLTGGGL